MAKNNDDLFEDVEYQAQPSGESDSLFEDVDYQEPSLLDTIGETAYDTAVGIANTGLGRMAIGVKGGVGELIGGDESESLLDQPEDQKSAIERFVKGYYEGKEDISKKAEQARERSPIATTVGNISAEIAAMAPIAKGAQAIGAVGKATSGLGKLAELVGVGAVEGAISGMGMGDAKLLEGDVAGTLEEAGEGALFGAGAAGIGAAAPKLLKGAVNTTKSVGKGIKNIGEGAIDTLKLQDPASAFGKAYRRALKGQGVSGVMREVQGKAKALATDLTSTVRGKRKTVGEGLKGLRDMADEGARVELGESLNAMNNILDDFGKTVSPAEAKTFKEYKSVRNWLNETIASLQDGSVDLKRARKINDEMKRMATNFMDGSESVKDKELLARMRDLSEVIEDGVDTTTLNQLKSKYSDRVKEYEKLKNNYRSLSELEKYIGTTSMGNRAKIGAQNKKAGEALVGRLADETYNLEAMMTQKELNDTLMEVGLSDFSKSINSEIKEIKDGIQLLQYLNPQGAGIGTSLGRNVGATTASTAGKVVKKVDEATKPIRAIKKGISDSIEKGAQKTQAVFSNVKQTLAGSDSEAIRAIGKKMEEAGKMRFSKMVNDLAEIKDPTQRAIRSHALLSQPAFRQDVRSILGMDNEEDK